MVEFESNTVAYNSVTVKMETSIFKEAVDAYKELRYKGGQSACPGERTLTEELQDGILSELENWFEYEDSVEKVLIGATEDELGSTHFIELKIKHEQRDEFEHIVIVEEVNMIQLSV